MSINIEQFLSGYIECALWSTTDLDSVITKLDVSRIIKTPFDKIAIIWTVDGYSGRSETEAWRGQHEIDQLERAGYSITAIEKVK